MVADIGAGKGELTLALAKTVDHVFSTEIDPGRLQRVRQAVVAASSTVVTVLEAYASDYWIAPELLRRDCTAPRVSPSHRPVRPERRLAARVASGWVCSPSLVPPPFFLGRGRFGVPAESVTTEVKAGGFELVRLIDDWPGRGALANYCALFREPM